MTPTEQWVIVRAGDGTKRGRYVAKPGRTSSYTNDLARAQRFPTYQQAWENACKDNESPWKIADILACGGEGVY